MFILKMWFGSGNRKSHAGWGEKEMRGGCWRGAGNILHLCSVHPNHNVRHAGEGKILVKPATTSIQLNCLMC